MHLMPRRVSVLFGNKNSLAPVALLSTCFQLQKKAAVPVTLGFAFLELVPVFLHSAENKATRQVVE